MTEFHTPRPIRAGDRLGDFHCGEPSLDQWIRGYARTNERRGASRTWVSATEEDRVAGFYCLSAFSLDRNAAPSELARNLPDPIPAVLIGRLAVDVTFAGNGLGRSMLQHAVMKSLSVAETVGVHVILVHALNDRVVSYYQSVGFTSFPGSERALYLRVKDAEHTLR